MRKNTKKQGSRFVLMLMIIGVMSVVPAGCSSQAEIPAYTLKDLPDKGYFIRHGDVYYPVYSEGLSFNTVPDINKLEGRYLLYMEDSGCLIPHLKDGDELILRSVESELPSAYYFEQFEDRGYTLGCIFTPKTVGLAFENSRKWLKNSSAYNRLDSVKNLESYTVLEINGEPFDPGLLDSNGMIVGLEKEKQYMLGAFEGTVYRELVMVSDTRYYTSHAVRTVDEDTAPYALTRKGYAVLTLPDHLQPGLYAINGEGLFFIG